MLHPPWVRSHWVRSHDPVLSNQSAQGIVQQTSTPDQPDSRTRWCRSPWLWLPLRCRIPRHTANHEHTMSTRDFRVERLDESSSKVQQASTRQPDSRTRWCQSALPCHRWRVPRHSANHEHTSHSTGALDESSSKVQEASTHR